MVQVEQRRRASSSSAGENNNNDDDDDDDVDDDADDVDDACNSDSDVDTTATTCCTQVPSTHSTTMHSCLRCDSRHICNVIFLNTTQYWFLLMLTPAGPCYN